MEGETCTVVAKAALPTRIKHGEGAAPRYGMTMRMAERIRVSKIALSLAMKPVLRQPIPCPPAAPSPCAALRIANLKTGPDTN